PSAPCNLVTRFHRSMTSRSNVSVKIQALRDLVLIAAILLSSALPLAGQPALAQEGATAREATLLAQLEQAGGGSLRISYHSETGRVRFLAGESGRPLTQAFAGPQDASPEADARAFLARY